MFVLAWILVSIAGTTYSPPVKSLEDCVRLQKANVAMTQTQCVQVYVLVNGVK